MTEHGGAGLDVHPAAAGASDPDAALAATARPVEIERHRVDDRRAPAVRPVGHRKDSTLTRVLVVEDEESFSDALSYMLRKEGFEVSVAATGPEALTEFDRTGADIVLLDLMLPETVRHRGLPAAAAAVARADHHAHRQGQRDRQGRRAGDRRRRLRDQAVLAARAGRPDPGGAAPPGRRRRASWPPPTLAAGPVRMDVERHVVTVAGDAGRSCRSRSSTCSSCCCATPAGCSPAGS